MNKKIIFSVQDINIGDGIKNNIEKILKEKFNNVIYIKDEFNKKDKEIKYKVFREIVKKADEQSYFKKLFRNFENKIKINEAEKYHNIDYFLIISGGKFSKLFCKILRKNNPNIKIILFLWDKLEYSYWKDKLENFDYIFSYDRIEALKNNFIFRPTFFIDECLNNIPLRKEYDLYYIGALKEEKRYNYLIKLKNYLNEKQIKTFFKLYAGKKSIRKLPKNYDKDLIINERINYEKNIEILKESKVVLDIKFKDQNGLSLRIYEALATNTKVITDSIDVKNYDFYNENNIKIINKIEDIEKISLDFFKSPFVQIDEKLKARYSVKGFIDDIFASIGK